MPDIEHRRPHGQVIGCRGCFGFVTLITSEPGRSGMVKRPGVIGWRIRQDMPGTPGLFTIPYK